MNLDDWLKNNLIKKESPDLWDRYSEKNLK